MPEKNGPIITATLVSISPFDNKETQLKDVTSLLYRLDEKGHPIVDEYGETRSNCNHIKVSQTPTKENKDISIYTAAIVDEKGQVLYSAESALEDKQYVKFHIETTDARGRKLVEDHYISVDEVGSNIELEKGYSKKNRGLEAYANIKPGDILGVAGSEVVFTKNDEVVSTSSARVPLESFYRNKNNQDALPQQDYGDRTLLLLKDSQCNISEALIEGSETNKKLNFLNRLNDDNYTAAESAYLVNKVQEYAGNITAGQQQALENIAAKFSITNSGDKIAGAAKGNDQVAGWNLTPEKIDKIAAEKLTPEEEYKKRVNISFPNARVGMAKEHEGVVNVDMLTYERSLTDNLSLRVGALNFGVQGTDSANKKEIMLQAFGKEFDNGYTLFNVQSIAPGNVGLSIKNDKGNLKAFTAITPVSFYHISTPGYDNGGLNVSSVTAGASYSPNRHISISSQAEVPFNMKAQQLDINSNFQKVTYSPQLKAELELAYRFMMDTKSGTGLSIGAGVNYTSGSNITSENPNFPKTDYNAIISPKLTPYVKLSANMSFILGK